MELYFQHFGKGQPLIILHGLFGMSDNWISLARQMAVNHSVYVVDQRNHGRSRHHQVFNYAAMVDDLLEFMDRHQLESAHLLGHSMGGKTVMQFAFDYPERVEKLVVADISPVAYNYKHYLLIEAMLSVDMARFGSRSQVEAELEKLIDNPRTRQFLLKNLYWKDRSSLGWKANLEVIQENLPEVFRAIESPLPFPKPTLFVRGGDSEYLQDTHLPLIQSLFPQSVVKTIPGASHWLHADEPEMFLELVMSFLQSHSLQD